MLKRFCRKAGCKNLTDSGYCSDHQAEAHSYDQYRESAAKRGYDSKWRKARLGYLRKHPVCKGCEIKGKITAATVVDHIIPHKGDKQLFWDRNNWQPLCKACHDTKTVRQDGGFGNGR